MRTEPLTKLHVVSMLRILGTGAMLFDVANIDYTRGRGILDGNDRCVWTKDGKRITIFIASDGGIISSQSKEADPNILSSVKEWWRL